MSISTDELSKRIAVNRAITETLGALPKMTVIMTAQQVADAVKVHPELLDPIALSVLDELASTGGGESMFRSFRANLERIQAGG